MVEWWNEKMKKCAVMRQSRIFAIHHSAIFAIPYFHISILH